jgi:RimJ/RimL family protein N-acetyltransferase
MTITLETQRLTLRPHALSDFDAYCALWADTDVVRFIGGKPFSREASWMRFLRHAGLWKHLGFGFLVIQEGRTGRFLGEAGFHDLKRDISPSIEGTLEAGWALAPAAHGQGYGYEAMQALIAWAEASFAGRRMTAIIDAGNAPSIRLAGKLGFRDHGPARYNGQPITLYERHVDMPV